MDRSEHPMASTLESLCLVYTNDIFYIIELYIKKVDLIKY